MKTSLRESVSDSRIRVFIAPNTIWYDPASISPLQCLSPYAPAYQCTPIRI